MNSEIEITKKSLDELINKYKAIIQILLEHQSKDGYSRVSQQKMAEALNCSPNIISQKIKVLDKYQAIQQINPGVYKVLNPSLANTPFLTLVQVLNLMKEHPHLVSSYKKQAELLNVDLKEIQRAWGMIHYLMQE